MPPLQNALAFARRTGNRIVFSKHTYADLAGSSIYPATQIARFIAPQDGQVSEVTIFSTSITGTQVGSPGGIVFTMTNKGQDGTGTVEMFGPNDTRIKAIPTGKNHYFTLASNLKALQVKENDVVCINYGSPTTGGDVNIVQPLFGISFT